MTKQSLCRLFLSVQTKVCTSQRLQDRMKQHKPKAIRNQIQPDRDFFLSNPTSTSAIEQHLLNNEKCAYYDDNHFSLLAKGKTLFHLSILETTLIKMLKSELCRLKEFIYTLNYIIDLDSTKRLVVYQSERSDIFTNFNCYKYFTINTRLHFSDKS